MSLSHLFPYFEQQPVPSSSVTKDKSLQIWQGGAGASPVCCLTDPITPTRGPEKKGSAFLGTVQSSGKDQSSNQGRKRDNYYLHLSDTGGSTEEGLRRSLLSALMFTGTQMFA